MYIKLGTIRANRLYNSPNDYMILSEVPSSGMSFESPTKVRTIQELNIWFGKDYPEYSYLCELLGAGAVLWLYGPVSPESTTAVDLSDYTDDYLETEQKIDYPSIEVLDDILGKNGNRNNIIFHVDGDAWIWYTNSWIKVSELPQNIAPESESLLNRDTLMVSVSDNPEIPEFCHPKYKIPDEEDSPEAFDISWSEEEGIYSSILSWSGEPLRSGYFGFQNSPNSWTVCYSGMSLQEAKRTLGNSAVFKKVSSVSDIIRVLQDYYTITESGENTWILRSSEKKPLISFISFPELSVSENPEDENLLIYSKIINSGCGYIQFWSRTVGQDKNQYDLENSKIQVSIEYTGLDGWLIEISRYEYTESFIGQLEGTADGLGVIDKINRSSRLVRCNLCGNTLREGSWYLSGATPLEPTAEWYRNSMRMLLDTLEDSVCPDFFMIPDLSLYGERKDERYFLPYATAGEFQYLIHEDKEEEYTKNYLADKENRLLYFYGNVFLDEDKRPGYYVYLDSILRNKTTGVSREISYDPRPNLNIFDGIHNPYITRDDLDEWKCNYLVCNNQMYYYNKYQNGGDDYTTSGTLRFIIGKIYREIQKNRWKILGKKFSALMENTINQILQRPSEFSQVRSIEITKFTPYPELNLLDIEIEVYTRELLKNNITLDVTINYNKE